MDLASFAGLPAAPASHDGLIWGIPFAGLLLSIAILPLILPRFWHHHFGKIALYWTLLLIAALTRAQGLEVSAAEVWRQMLVEYLPFLALLLALYTAGGGILLEGGPWGTPGGNTLLLAIGTLAAGVLGTTGVSMVLIHPLLRANAHRRRRVHLVVFFILLCANAGGVTSPLGDPPLYVGFLRNVPFFWPLTHLAGLLAMVALPLLAVFWLIDRRLARGDRRPTATPLRLTGGVNFALVLVVAAVVLGQGIWHPGQVRVLGAAIDIERLVGMAVLFGVAALSWRITPQSIRQRNLFSWSPMIEVALLFAAIFATIIPVETMLHAGAQGPLAPLLLLTKQADGAPSPAAYFFITGALAAVLDNAPTYLVFFQLAGDDAARLTGDWAQVLRAISAGAVFFGGLTYIGNAPNMLVRSIAAHRGVRMPGFFTYAAMAAVLLGPLLVLVALVL